MTISEQSELARIRMGFTKDQWARRADLICQAYREARNAGISGEEFWRAGEVGCYLTPESLDEPLNLIFGGKA